MSIFTRLNLFIALAIASVIAFVAIVDQNLRLQDKLTLEYRQVARQQIALNRLQANVLEERVGALAYRKNSDLTALDQISARRKIIREQLSQARALGMPHPLPHWITLKRSNANMKKHAKAIKTPSFKSKLLHKKR